jgi:hypothetical protein
MKNCNEYPFEIIEFVMLFTKYYIHCCKWSNKLPTIEVLKAKLKSREKMERSNSIFKDKSFLNYFVIVNFHFFYRQHIHHITCTEQDKHIISVNDSYCYLCLKAKLKSREKMERSNSIFKDKSKDHEDRWLKLL